MSEQLIVGISGVRGIIGENLTAAIATEYGCAFGTFLKGRFKGKNGRGKVCIGRDSRPSGTMLKSAVISGLCAAGIDVVDLGIVTTPSVGIMLRRLGCDGGVVVTASHNPIKYNGIKLLLENGIAPPADCVERIKACYFDKSFSLADSVNCGDIESNDQSDDIHISKILSIIDRGKIKSKGFKVVLDSVNGAGGAITKKLLEQFGCEVYPINSEPTGLFAHEPEPIAENLTQLCESVKTKGADVGFAQDPDADRLAIVDEKGRFIGEEYTLALAAKHAFSKKSGTAATNLSTSRMIDDIAAPAGGKVIRTPVGEANVAGAMIENKCMIGGEGNGGVIDLRVGPVRDSLVGIGFVLELMGQTGKSISELVGEFISYYMSKEKFRAGPEEAEKILELAKDVFAGAKVNTSDGCRFDFDDGWVHLRISNTEPVMRLIVEATDEQAAAKYIESVRQIRNKVLG